MGFKILKYALEKAGISSMHDNSKEKWIKTNVPAGNDRPLLTLDNKNTKKNAKDKPTNIVAPVKKRTSKDINILPQAASPIVQTENEFLISAPLKLHPLLNPYSPTDRHKRNCSENENIRYNINENALNQTDIVIGLDFGTSSTKVIVRDVSLEKAFVVPFFTTESNENNFLIPSRLFWDENGYSLDNGNKCFQDLKLQLLNTSYVEDGSFNQSAIYLALVLRHCRNWLFTSYYHLYSQTEIWWKINLGLPARHYEDKDLVERFKKLAWCAEFLAVHGPDILTDDDAENSKKSWINNASSLKTDIDVVPEIAAQIYGYIRSRHWDKNAPHMMMLDIGAGTLDAAFFSVEQEDDDNFTYKFRGVDVKPHGVMNLHRKRVSWLSESLLKLDEHKTKNIRDELELIAYPTDRITTIPEDVRDYIYGLKISINDENQFVDSEFAKKIWLQINNCALWPIRDLENSWNKEKIFFPIFVCGGGSRMRFYQKPVLKTKEPGLRYGFEEKTLPKPNDLQTENLEENYDRFSVAYGLSWHMAGERPLGDFVRSLDMPQIENSGKKISIEDRYISKDQV